jgi:hypothetical protein
MVLFAVVLSVTVIVIIDKLTHNAPRKYYEPKKNGVKNNYIKK